MKNKLLLLLLLLITPILSCLGKPLNTDNESIYNSLDSVFRFYEPEHSEYVTSSIKLTDRFNLRDLCSKDMSYVPIININSEFEAYYVSYYGINDGWDFVLLKIGNEYRLYDWEKDKIKVLKFVNKLFHNNNPQLSKERWDILVNNLLTYRDRKYYPIETTIGNLQIYFNMKK